MTSNPTQDGARRHLIRSSYIISRALYAASHENARRGSLHVRQLVSIFGTIALSGSLNKRNDRLPDVLSVRHGLHSQDNASGQGPGQIRTGQHPLPLPQYTACSKVSFGFLDMSTSVRALEVVDNRPMLLC